jgi:putative ABC transport system permease protein
MILRLALRDLRGGLAGLRLLAVCLFLGVAALAGVGSLTAAVLAGLGDQGQAILGGDVQVEMNQRQARPRGARRLCPRGRGQPAGADARHGGAGGGGDPVLGRAEGRRPPYPFYGSFALRPARWRSGRAGSGRDRAELADKLGARSARTCASATRPCASSA